MENSGSTVRLTSLEALTEMRASGRLSRSRLQVFEALTAWSPFPRTANELWLDIQKVDRRTFRQNTHSRLGELVKMGLVEEAPVRACGITGRVVLTYRITGYLPTMTTRETKRRSKLDEARGRIRDLEAEVAQLHQRIQNLIDGNMPST